MRAVPVPVGEGAPGVSVSIGVAVMSGPKADFRRALAEADSALYAAKAAGRNCVRLAEVA